MAATEKKKTDTVPGFRVRTATDGFRRGGREWRGVTEVPASQLTTEQIAEIKAEPKLVVDDIEIEISAAADTGSED